MPDILLRPDLTFSDGRQFLPLPDLDRLARESMPDDAAIDASNAAAEARRETVARVFAELFGQGDPAWVREWVE